MFAWRNLILPSVILVLMQSFRAPVLPYLSKPHHLPHSACPAYPTSPTATSRSLASRKQATAGMPGVQRPVLVSSRPGERFHPRTESSCRFNPYLLHGGIVRVLVEQKLRQVQPSRIYRTRPKSYAAPQLYDHQLTFPVPGSSQSTPDDLSTQLSIHTFPLILLEAL